jgi:homoserine dehydrogenase
MVGGSKKVMMVGGEGVVVAVIGYTGGVGRCLMKAMEKIGLKPYALVRSQTMRICGGGGGGMDEEEEVPVNWEELSRKLLEASKCPIIADVTASDIPQSYYKTWLEQGISICTANKGIFAGPESHYQALQLASSSNNNNGGGMLKQEATVGAGLPVLSTLDSLRASSHDIVRVEGILSGTLAFVLGAVSGGDVTFSEAVKQAKELGYTEPDPRLDLSGMDVARKAVILARTSGMTGIELEGLTVESLVPPALEHCSVDEFMNQLSNYDDDFSSRMKTTTPGQRWHYAAKVDVTNHTVSVGPMAVDADHPFNAAGPDNLFAITTNFYNPRPLVIQGAGAGGDVTATGVLADILSCTKNL